MTLLPSFIATDGERNWCKKDDSQVLSEKVTFDDKFYNFDTIMKVENNFYQDQIKPMKSNFLYETNYSLEILENQTKEITEEPFDAWPETGMSPLISLSHEMDTMKTVDSGITIKKEEATEEDKGMLVSRPYHFEILPERHNNSDYYKPFRTAVKYEDTSQIYRKEVSSCVGDLSLSGYQFTGDSSKSNGTGCSGSQQSEVYHDRAGICLVDVSVVLEDTFPKTLAADSRRSSAKESNAKSHSPTFGHRCSELPPIEMKIRADISGREESCQADTNSHEQFKESVPQEWYPCTLCLARFKFVSSLSRHLAFSHHLHYCVECEATFQWQSDLHAHLTTHTVKKLHSCPYCHFKSKLMWKLRIHASEHLNKKLFSCGQCFAEFDDSWCLRTHILTHSDGKPFVCAHCSVRVRTKAAIKSHMHVHMIERPLACPSCPATFKWRGSLNYHKQAFHGSEKKPQCAQCTATFRTKKALERHIFKQHQDSNSCKFCPEKFTNPSALTHHVIIFHSSENSSFLSSYCPTSSRETTCVRNGMKKHNALKPLSCTTHTDSVSPERHHAMQLRDQVFACSYCSLTFTTPSSLVEHLSTHTIKESFPSPDLGVSLGVKSNLKQHQSTHTDRTLFACAYCPSNFKLKYKFENHLTVHTQGSFVCKDCPARFGSESRLVKHQRIHRNEKRFMCSYCPLKFSREIYLKIHLTTHPNEEVFICPDCFIRFSKKSDLELHQSTHIGEESCQFSFETFKTNQT